MIIDTLTFDRAEQIEALEDLRHAHQAVAAADEAVAARNAAAARCKAAGVPVQVAADYIGVDKSRIKRLYQRAEEGQ